MTGTTKRAWTMGLALAFAAPTGCSAQPPETIAEQGKGSMIPAPPGAAEDLGAAADNPAASALATLVAGQVGSHRITGAHYYAMQSNIGWNAISKYVASQRAPDGLPPRPRWSDQGLELIDLYPIADDRHPFAVAMAKDALPDGTKLVGYFDLTEER